MNNCLLIVGMLRSIVEALGFGLLWLNLVSLRFRIRYYVCVLYNLTVALLVTRHKPRRSGSEDRSMECPEGEDPKQ